MAESKELQAKGKEKITNPIEQTRTGLFFTPAVDIFETEREITLLVDMPGVASDKINIDLDDRVLTLTGSPKTWEGKDETDLLVEFEFGKYFRQFTLSEIIDQEKIEAKYEDGVLRLVLPKAEKAIPRKIAVNSI